MKQKRDNFLTFLNEIVVEESNESLEVLGGYIIGQIFGVYDGEYDDLYEEDKDIQRIVNLAGDLETSNGTEEQLAAMWEEIKSTVTKLNSEPI